MGRVVIYRSRPSTGALRLAESLRGRGIQARKVRRLATTRYGAPRLTSDDLLICWGDVGPQDHPWSLNNIPIPNKLEELQVLKDADVPTVEFSTVVEEGWLPRSKYHSQGRDLTTPPTHPGYWVKREEFEYECRVHVWDGVSIRAGRKRPADGETPHEWIRSRSNGWVVDYSLPIHRRERDAAKAAVTALGLLFGAVDVGVLPNGEARVLEVNRAPGLEGNTVEKYADVIERLWNGQRGLSSD